MGRDVGELVGCAVVGGFVGALLGETDGSLLGETEGGLAVGLVVGCWIEKRDVSI